MLSIGGFDLRRAAEEVVEQHPAPLQSHWILANYDILQIDATIQAGQEEE